MRKRVLAGLLTTAVAAGMFGMPAAVALRIGANVFGAVYTVVCNQLLARIGKKQAVAA